MRTVEEFRAGWLGAESLEFGRQFMHSLSVREPAMRAGSLAEVLSLQFNEIDALRVVGVIGPDSARWPDARSAFDALRAKLLDLEACGGDNAQVCVLECAELCAKTMYNGILPVAGFDADSSWHLFPASAAVVLSRSNPTFTRAVWSALVGRWLRCPR